MPILFLREPVHFDRTDGKVVSQLKFKSRPDVVDERREAFEELIAGQERSFRERLRNDEKSFAVIITRSFREAREKNTGHFYVFPGATVTELPCTPRRGIRYPVFELARVFTNGRAFLHSSRSPRFVTFSAAEGGDGREWKRNFKTTVVLLQVARNFWLRFDGTGTIQGSSLEKHRVF